MPRRSSMSTRAALLAAVRQRYEAPPRRERRRILDDFGAVSGYHRKHAILLLRSGPRECAPGRPRERRYDGRVREGLIVLWECSDRLCSKRLKPLIPALLPGLERHDKLVLDDATRACLLSVSPATIDRLLS